MEVYMFKRGEVADRFVEALTERARAGVRVTVVMDADGQLRELPGISPAGCVHPGCRVEPYQRLMWYRLARLEQPHPSRAARGRRRGGLRRRRRHRGLVDGSRSRASRSWRDMAARIEGPIVRAIQGIARRELARMLRSDPAAGDLQGSPEGRRDAARSWSRARRPIVPPPRVCCSRRSSKAPRRSVRISTPYFLRTRHSGARWARVARGVASHRRSCPAQRPISAFLRLASRRYSGALIKAGMHIRGYQPGMTHVKTMIVDDLWSVIGIDQPRQPVVRAQRRDERGDPRSCDCRAADLRLRGGTSAIRARSRWRSGVSGRFGRSSSARWRGSSNASSRAGRCRRV